MNRAGREELLHSAQYAVRDRGANRTEVKWSSNVWRVREHRQPR